jgi:hypothetical protein
LLLLLLLLLLRIIMAGWECCCFDPSVITCALLQPADYSYVTRLVVSSWKLDGLTVADYCHCKGSRHYCQ